MVGYCHLKRQWCKPEATGTACSYNRLVTGDIDKNIFLAFPIKLLSIFPNRWEALTCTGNTSVARRTSSGRRWRSQKSPESLLLQTSSLPRLASWSSSSSSSSSLCVNFQMGEELERYKLEWVVTSSTPVLQFRVEWKMVGREKSEWQSEIVEVRKKILLHVLGNL